MSIKAICKFFCMKFSHLVRQTSLLQMDAQIDRYFVVGPFAIWYNSMSINQHITTWHMHWTYHTCKTNHNDVEARQIDTLQQYMDVSYIMSKFILWNQHDTSSNGKRGRETLSGLWAPYLVHKCLICKYNQCGGAGSTGCNTDLSQTCICERWWSFIIQWYSNCMYYVLSWYHL